MEQLSWHDKSRKAYKANDAYEAYNVDKADSARKNKSILSALFALFALSTLVWSAGFSFDRKTQLSGRMITPNGDGKNDIVVFRYTNPMDSAVTLKIYGVSGALISTTKSQAGDTQISWNGKDANGQSAPSGVYIYNLESEGDIYRGTIIVAR